MEQTKEKIEDRENDLVRMFCSYCRRVLANARTDVLREKSRALKSEKLFSEMRDPDLARLSQQKMKLWPETIFTVLGRSIGVGDPDLADALSCLDEQNQTIILLYYFASWSDGQIGDAIGRPRSTVQFRRAQALKRLRGVFEERGYHHAHF